MNPLRLCFEFRDWERFVVGEVGCQVSRRFVELDDIVLNEETGTVLV